jgi:hypothetical protein
MVLEQSNKSELAFMEGGGGVTVAIHRPSAGGDDRNEHAHVMLTTRGIGADGWGEKIRELNSLPQVSQEVVYIR